MHEKPITRRGVVYLWDGVGYNQDNGRFLGYWQGRDGMRAVFLADGPGWDDVDDALAWARERAEVVWLQLSPQGEDGPIVTYSAGTMHPDPSAPVWLGQEP